MTSERDDQMLDDAFVLMRVADTDPSEDLLNRIMMDADGVLAGGAPVASKRGLGAVILGIGPMVLDLIGGWPSLGGLAAATVAGLWIGVVQPDAFTDLSAGLWGGTIEVPLLESDVFAGLDV